MLHDLLYNLQVQEVSEAVDAHIVQGDVHARVRVHVPDVRARAREGGGDSLCL